VVRLTTHVARLRRHERTNRYVRKLTHDMDEELPLHVQKYVKHIAIKMHSNFDNQNSVHQDTIYFRLSLVTASIEKLLCIAMASVVLCTPLMGGKEVCTIDVAKFSTRGDRARLWFMIYIEDCASRLPG